MGLNLRYSLVPTRLRPLELGVAVVVLPLCGGRNRRRRRHNLAELKKRRLADKLQCRVRILDTGEVDDDPVGTLPLDDGFRHTVLVHAIPKHSKKTFDAVLRHLAVRGVLRLKNDVGAALQI